MHLAIIDPVFKSLRTALPTIALLIAGCIAGCAAIAPPEPGAPQQPAQDMAPRAYHQAIDLGGRLSVRYQRNGNDEAVHGSFTWMQSPERTVVGLLSPLGQTLAMIEITPNQSILTQAGQPPRAAADVDALAADALGWPLPVSGLREWLQGFATDAGGRRFIASPLVTPASTITNDGWKLSYASWEDGPEMSLRNHPKRIDLERSTAEAGEVALRIVIDNWQPR